MVYLFMALSPANAMLGTNQDVVNFRQLMTGGKRAPGLPKFDPNRGVCVLCLHSTRSCDQTRPPASWMCRSTAVSRLRSLSLSPPSAGPAGRSRSGLSPLARTVRILHILIPTLCLPSMPKSLAWYTGHIQCKCRIYLSSCSFCWDGTRSRLVSE